MHRSFTHLLAVLETGSAVPRKLRRSLERFERALDLLVRGAPAHDLLGRGLT